MDYDFDDMIYSNNQSMCTGQVALALQPGPEKDRRDKALGYITTKTGLMDMRFTSNPLVLREKQRRLKLSVK
jgi:hypothetical protein